MSIIERGVKRRCGSCDAPFYDMGRRPILCPKCGAPFEASGKRLASVPRAPRGRKAVFGAAAKVAPTPVAEEAGTDEVTAADAEEEAPDDTEIDEVAADDDLVDEIVDDPVEDDGDDKPKGDL